MPALYLLRHGTAVDEAEDPARPLSAAGEAEVDATIARIQDPPTGPVYHSAKLRAKQTAQRVATASAQRLARAHGRGRGECKAFYCMFWTCGRAAAAIAMSALREQHENKIKGA